MLPKPKICPFYDICTAPECKEANYPQCKHYAQLSFIHSLPIPLTCPFHEECGDECSIYYIDILEDYRTCPTFSKKFWKLVTQQPKK